MTFRSALLLVATGVAGAAHADILSQWTFETSVPAAAGPISPEVGPGAGSILHATSSAYTSPAGNGSAHSFSSTMWSVNDYYQFTGSSLGESNVQFSFDQTSSNTGPADFALQYSTNGLTSFTQYATYTVLGNGTTPNLSWSATNGYQSAYTYKFDLSGIAALNNNANIAFRLVDLDSTSAAGGTVGTGGTDRVDNVTSLGTPKAVPEPSAMAALGLGAMAFVRRRKG